MLGLAQFWYHCQLREGVLELGEGFLELGEGLGGAWPRCGKSLAKVWESLAKVWESLAKVWKLGEGQFELHLPPRLCSMILGPPGLKTTLCPPPALNGI